MSKHGTRWICMDIVGGMISLVIAFYLSPKMDTMPQLYYILIVGFIFGIILSGSVLICGVPVPGKTQRIEIYQTISTTVISSVLAYTIFSVVVYMLLFKVYGRYFGVFTILFCSILGIAYKLFFQYVIKKQPKRLLIYGDNDVGNKFLNKIKKNQYFKFIGFLDDFNKSHKRNKDDPLILGSGQLLDKKFINECNPDMIVLCINEQIDSDKILELINFPLEGVEVITYFKFIEIYYQEVFIGGLTTAILNNYSISQSNNSLSFFKRSLDLITSTVGIILVIPLCILIVLLIKIDSIGPVFYTQKRVGLKGREFIIFKFRTMRINSEESGAQWAKTNDSRITKFGKILRFTRLDELPQLLNVILGHMSIVGPRPERPEFCTELCKNIPLYNIRHLTRPGLTGWAQIRYRYGSSELDSKAKLQYDLYYIQHLSLLFDLKIILMTIPMLMKGSR